MKRDLQALFVLLLILVVDGGSPSAWPKVLLIGDSITEMAVGPSDAPWSALLSQYLHRKADVVNRGASGYTTRGYKSIFREAVQDLDPGSVAVAVIFLGANDADQPPSPSYVSLSQYQSNLRDLVQLLHDFGVGKERVILLPPPPFYASSHANTRVPEVTEMYARSAQRVAETSGITTLDIHTIFRTDVRGEKLFSDGLHFNLDGAKLFFDSVLPVIEDKLKAYEGREQLVHHFGPPS